MSAFDEFFSDHYGERWLSLYSALKEPTKSVAFKYAEDSQNYFLDAASIIAAQALPFDADARVLDLCAAPGGKTLILASKLGATGTLIANERSATRRQRLRKVIEAHLPNHIQSQIQVTSHDASRWCLYEQNAYDAVLLDAPCSSERHLIHQGNALDKWSPKGSKSLAQRQYAMLASALSVTKRDGYILYSTCSISPYENEGVVERLLTKKSEYVRAKKLSLKKGEPTGFGWIMLPDKTEGSGPLYCALLQKLKST